LPGERNNARNNARCTQARKTTHGLDGQHQYVNMTLPGRVRMIKDRDKWRTYVHGWPTLGSRTAKNRTEQNSAQNLRFIFDEHLTSSDQIRPIYLSKSCYNYIHQLRCIRPYLNSSTTCTIATSIVYSTINVLRLNYPVSRRSRILLLVLSLKLLSPVISLQSHALSTGSESLNASNTSSSHLLTKFSPNVHTFITLSLFNVLACSTRSSSVVTFARPPTSFSV